MIRYGIVLIRWVWSTTWSGRRRDSTNSREGKGRRHCACSRPSRSQSSLRVSYHTFVRLFVCSYAIARRWCLVITIRHSKVAQLTSRESRSHRIQAQRTRAALAAKADDRGVMDRSQESRPSFGDVTESRCHYVLL